MHFCVLFDIAYSITKEVYLNTFKYNEQNNKKKSLIVDNALFLFSNKPSQKEITLICVHV